MGMPQTAKVYVDGAYAGMWRHAYQNGHLRWFDSDFDISSKYTRGKSTLALKLEVVDTPDCSAYADFSYRVFCFEKETADR